MKLNRYLKELGLTQMDLPGYYNPNEKIEDYKPGLDPRNEEDNEGFCRREFFSLDYSMALYIYPRLCEFRKYYAPVATPGCFCYNKKGKEIKNGSEKWLETLDKMILAFKYIITQPSEIDYKQREKIIERGLYLFAKYYGSLWY